MADETTQGALPADEEVIKETRPRAGGLSLAGSKGVALEAAQSDEIRNRLLEMIKAREAEKGGWGDIMARAAVSAGRPGTFQSNLESYQNAQKARDQDIFNMRLGVAQLETEQQRLAQARAKQKQDQAMFVAGLFGGMPGQAAPTPGAGVSTPGAGVSTPGAGVSTPGAGAPTQGAPMGNNLSPQQQAMLYALYQQNPQAAITKYIELTKTGDVERRLLAAGVQPGSPQWNTLLAANVAGAGAFAPHDLRTATGTVQQTPLQAAGQFIGGGLPTAPGAAPMPTPAPQAAAPARQPAAPQPAPQAAAPAVQSVQSPFAPGSKEDLEFRAKMAATKVEGLGEEEKGMGKTYVDQFAQHVAESAAAPANAQLAQRMQSDIRDASSVLGKMAKAGSMSAFLGLVDKGVQMGQFGAVRIPGLQEAIVKLDPAAKNPAVMEAYNRLGQDLTKMKLDYTRKVFQGQGSVTENERALIDKAVGDPAHTTPRNLMMIAKGLEIEATNRSEQDALWKQFEARGATWRTFANSPERKQLQRAQFYRTAKVFNQPDALYPGDSKRPEGM